MLAAVAAAIRASGDRECGDTGGAAEEEEEEEDVLLEDEDEDVDGEKATLDKSGESSSSWSTLSVGSSRWRGLAGGKDENMFDCWNCAQCFENSNFSPFCRFTWSSDGAESWILTLPTPPNPKNARSTRRHDV